MSSIISSGILNIELIIGYLILLILGIITFIDCRKNGLSIVKSILWLLGVLTCFIIFIPLWITVRRFHTNKVKEKYDIYYNKFFRISPVVIIISTCIYAGFFSYIILNIYFDFEILKFYGMKFFAYKIFSVIITGILFWAVFTTIIFMIFNFFGIKRKLKISNDANIKNPLDQRLQKMLDDGKINIEQAERLNIAIQKNSLNPSSFYDNSNINSSKDSGQIIMEYLQKQNSKAKKIIAAVIFFIICIASGSMYSIIKNSASNKFNDFSNLKMFAKINNQEIVSFDNFKLKNQHFIISADSGVFAPLVNNFGRRNFGAAIIARGKYSFIENSKIKFSDTFDSIIFITNEDDYQFCLMEINNATVSSDTKYFYNSQQLYDEFINILSDKQIRIPFIKMENFGKLFKNNSIVFFKGGKYKNLLAAFAEKEKIIIDCESKKNIVEQIPECPDSIEGFLEIKRSGAAAVTLNDKIYVSNGLGDKTESKNTIERYDSLTKKSTVLHSS